MTIILEVISTVDNDIFDRVFDSSFPHMENGSVDWELYRNLGFTVDTEEQKKETIKTMLNLSFNKDNMQVCSVSKDNYVVIYLVAKRQHTGQYSLPIFLAGPDSNGSKSYLYDPAFRDTIREHALNFNNETNNREVKFTYNNSENNTLRSYMNNFQTLDNAVREDFTVDPDLDFSDEGVVKIKIPSDV
mgnify:CR=1 FL=1